MNVNIDFTKLMNSKLNDIMLRSNLGTDDPDTDERVKTLVKFANKYGFFGTDAMNFISDLAMTLSAAIKNKEE